MPRINVEKDRQAQREGTLSDQGRSPRAYKQGQLDALCGIYAIINAIRNACASAGIKKRIGWSELFETMLEAVEEQKGVKHVICHGMGNRTHDHCLKAGSLYLRDKHGIVLQTSKLWRGKKELNIKAAFAAIRSHLNKPGHSALLQFETTYWRHWSVIQSVINDEVLLSDSAGYRTRLVPEFEFGNGIDLRPGMKSLVGSSSLILLFLGEKEPT